MAHSLPSLRSLLNCCLFKMSFLTQAKPEPAPALCIVFILPFSSKYSLHLDIEYIRSLDLPPECKLYEGEDILYVLCGILSV